MRLVRALLLAAYARFATRRADHLVDVGNRLLDEAEAAGERSRYWAGRAEWAHRRLIDLYPREGRRQ